MIQLLEEAKRGRTNLGWLDSRHTFSFGDFHEPKQMGFGALRVINDDRVKPGMGFGTHAHQDMEILSFVLEGAIAHKDSMGNGSTIEPGDVQRMSAGTGVRHSEFNPSKTEGLRFLQIWIIPEQAGIAPGYEQKRFSPEQRAGQLRLVASRDGRQGSVTVHQDVAIYAGTFQAGQSAELVLASGRSAWVQVAQGGIELNGKRLKEGDGAAVTGEQQLRFHASGPGELLVFDLA
jgi:redox-sensitive bicupin YhaK (pirin superfamily)